MSDNLGTNLLSGLTEKTSETKEMVSDRLESLKAVLQDKIIEIIKYDLDSLFENLKTSYFDILNNLQSNIDKQ